MPPRREGAVGRVARRVQRESGRTPRQRLTACWDRMLKITSLESVHRGVLPAIWDLAFDATPVESGAHSFGKKICVCSGKRCKCLRYFSDPMALLGWDSYRNRYYFGYSPQACVVVNVAPHGKSHPLIVSLALHPADLKTRYPVWGMGKANQRRGGSRLCVWIRERYAAGGAWSVTV